MFIFNWLLINIGIRLNKSISVFIVFFVYDLMIIVDLLVYFKKVLFRFYVRLFFVKCGYD